MNLKLLILSLFIFNFKTTFCCDINDEKLLGSNDEVYDEAENNFEIEYDDYYLIVGHKFNKKFNESYVLNEPNNFDFLKTNKTYFIIQYKTIPLNESGPVTILPNRKFVIVLPHNTTNNIKNYYKTETTDYYDLFYMNETDTDFSLLLDEKEHQVQLLDKKYKLIVLVNTVFRNFYNQNITKPNNKFSYKVQNYEENFLNYAYKLPYAEVYLAQMVHLGRTKDINDEITDKDLEITSQHEYSNNFKPFSGDYDVHDGACHSYETIRRLVSYSIFNSDEFLNIPISVLGIQNELCQYENEIVKHGYHSALGIANIVQNSFDDYVGNELLFEFGKSMGLFALNGACRQKAENFVLNYHPNKIRSYSLLRNGNISYPRLYDGNYKKSIMNGGDFDESDDEMGSYSDFSYKILEQNIQNYYYLREDIKFEGETIVLTINNYDTELELIKVNFYLPYSTLQSGSNFIRGYKNNREEKTVYFSNSNRVFALPQELLNNDYYIVYFNKVYYKFFLRRDSLQLPKMSKI